MRGLHAELVDLYVELDGDAAAFEERAALPKGTVTISQPQQAGSEKSTLSLSAGERQKSHPVSHCWGSIVVVQPDFMHMPLSGLLHTQSSTPPFWRPRHCDLWQAGMWMQPSTA